MAEGQPGGDRAWLANVKTKDGSAMPCLRQEGSRPLSRKIMRDCVRPARQAGSMGITMPCCPCLQKFQTWTVMRQCRVRQSRCRSSFSRLEQSRQLGDDAPYFVVCAIPKAETQRILPELF